MAFPLTRLVAGALILCVGFAMSFPGTTPAAAEHRETYGLEYRVRLQPQSGMAHVTITLKGSTLPSRLVFTIDPERHSAFEANGKLAVDPQSVTWYPPPTAGTLRFNFRVNHALESGSYDSYMTDDWVLFRGDRMIPPVRSRASRTLFAETTLQFDLPNDWSVLTPYPERAMNRFVIDNPARRFERPMGWMLAGKIGSRHETIAGVNTVVGSPTGSGARRQDTLAFLNWNLPHVKAIFPEFPARLLVVRADDPLFRGGLSGPNSLFLHSDRPLISENRTSPLLHEVIHVAMGISGDPTSDWIVEGMAEYYSIEILRRSGGISERRFRDATARQDSRGARAPNLFVATSSGAVTARAVSVLIAADQEIREATAGKASLDNVARELAADRGEVSLERLQSVAARIAGKPLRSLERSRLEDRN